MQSLKESEFRKSKEMSTAFILMCLLLNFKTDIGQFCWSSILPLRYRPNTLKRNNQVYNTRKTRGVGRDFYLIGNGKIEKLVYYVYLNSLAVTVDGTHSHRTVKVWKHTFATSLLLELASVGVDNTISTAHWNLRATLGTYSGT